MFGSPAFALRDGRGFCQAGVSESRRQHQDRAALGMILRRSGGLDTPGAQISRPRREYRSGPGLIGVNRGYKVTLFVPRLRRGKVHLMRGFGAEVIRREKDGMQGAIETAKTAHASTPG